MDRPEEDNRINRCVSSPQCAARVRRSPRLPLCCQRLPLCCERLDISPWARGLALMSALPAGPRISGQAQASPTTVI
jgi:hypothetical protein